MIFEHRPVSALHYLDADPTLPPYQPQAVELIVDTPDVRVAE
jgi:hypothetical protein